MVNSKACARILSEKLRAETSHRTAFRRIVGLLTGVYRFEKSPYFVFVTMGWEGNFFLKMTTLQ